MPAKQSVTMDNFICRQSVYLSVWHTWLLLASYVYFGIPSYCCFSWHSWLVQLAKKETLTPRKGCCCPHGSIVGALDSAWVLSLLLIYLSEKTQRDTEMHCAVQSLVQMYEKSFYRQIICYLVAFNRRHSVCRTARKTRRESDDERKLHTPGNCSFKWVEAASEFELVWRWLNTEESFCFICLSKFKQSGNLEINRVDHLDKNT